MSWQFWSSVGVFALFNLGLYGWLILKTRKYEAKYKLKFDNPASMSHDNPDGPCSCGATHMLSRGSDRENFRKEVIRTYILKKIKRYEEEIESGFREIQGWMDLLDDPP
jgi:hypothetical protein